MSEPVRATIADARSVEIFRYMPSICYLATIPDGFDAAPPLRTIPTTTGRLVFVDTFRPGRVVLR